MRLISQARDEDVATTPMRLVNLPEVDAVFATNAAVGVRLVSAVDESQWPTEHPTLHILRKQYTDISPERV
jgi:branched-subunit amino acid aminotransferase/4-amino-4-deoxychorismate lyase